MKIQAINYKPGYNAVTELDGLHGEMGLDFGILILTGGQIWQSSLEKERAYLLMKGRVRFSYRGRTITGERHSLLDEKPWVLHVPAGFAVEMECLSPLAEISVESTVNRRDFEPVFYTPGDIRTDIFGRGTLGETSAREVRTVFDGENAPWSEMVLGEVINYPGRWSSYPPHDHPQPEIYHYRFFPEQGFGVSIEEEEAWVIRNGDTCTIHPHKVHSQASSPGYALYYLWMIPHLPENRFYPHSRRFRPEHVWLLEPEAEVWPDLSH